MTIDPDRLRSQRKKQKLSLVKLAEKTRRVNPPGITEKTIQRLEATQNTAVREHTIESLVKALNVEPGVLTCELPLPESDNMPTDNPDRVQIGAQIAPKTRLAYDLIKRRYGVNATEIINMAPLFFVLLAEGSLAWRREKLEDMEEVIGRFEQIESELGYEMLGRELEYEILGDLIWEDYVESEEGSISKGDLFGKDLYHLSGNMPFDPSTNNPFANYLRKMADDLAIPDVVDVARDGLSFESPLKFPDYDVCRKERDLMDKIAKMCLKAGYARLSDIPEELMAEDAREELAKWIEDKLPDIYKERGEWNVFKEVTATVPDDKIKKLLIEEEGDDE